MGTLRALALVPAAVAAAILGSCGPPPPPETVRLSAGQAAPALLWGRSLFAITQYYRRVDEADDMTFGAVLMDYAYLRAYYADHAKNRRLSEPEHVALWDTAWPRYGGGQFTSFSVSVHFERDRVLGAEHPLLDLRRWGFRLVDSNGAALDPVAAEGVEPTPIEANLDQNIVGQSYVGGYMTGRIAVIADYRLRGIVRFAYAPGRGVRWIGLLAFPPSGGERFEVRWRLAPPRGGTRAGDADQ